MNDEDAKEAGRRRRHKTLPEDRRARAEMMQRAKSDVTPPTEPEDVEYLDDLSKRMKLG